MTRVYMYNILVYNNNNNNSGSIDSQKNISHRANANTKEGSIIICSPRSPVTHGEDCAHTYYYISISFVSHDFSRRFQKV